jgi:NAD(P)-dependent dehydrogenase (short-subunit alcohol dehydrogenase family)
MASTGALQGKTALVTGGGRGIGRGAALELARHGAAVAILSRSEAEVAEVAGAISSKGGRALALSADVADFAAVTDAVERTARELGPVDILVNNAAIIGPLNLLGQTDPAEWTRVMAINVNGAYHCMRLVLPGMLERDWGRIINVSSGAATGSGLPRASAYSASKAALDMITLAAASELAGSNVCVNAVYPGVVDTAMQTALRAAPPEEFGSEASARFHGYYERGELLDPHEPGRLITAVAISDLHGYVLKIQDSDSQVLLRNLG